MTQVRLAQATARLMYATMDRTPPPSLRLAHAAGAQGDNVLKGQRGVSQLPPELAPALLVSYYYLDPFKDQREKFLYRDWAMDSGAFSAKNSGKVIDLQEYIDTCARLLEEDDRLTEVFALDVIGDWEMSLRNTEDMWRQGVPAIPAFHLGSPEPALMEIAARYPKIALGGLAHLHGMTKRKLLWAEQCFARVWPKKIHGFGFCSRGSLEKLPWHSVDATNWETGPCKFGNWASYRGALSVKGSNQNLRIEVEYFLNLEREAQERWKEEMKMLDEVVD